MSTTTNKFAPEVRERAVRMVVRPLAGSPVQLGDRGVHRREDRLRAADAA